MELRKNSLDIKEKYFQLFSDNSQKSYVCSITNMEGKELGILILDTRNLITKYGQEERNSLIKTQFLQGQNNRNPPNFEQQQTDEKIDKSSVHQQIPHMYLRMNLKNENQDLSLDQLRMFTHETGHAVHSVLSTHDFQLPGNNYKIDFAQVCSTVLQNFLYDSHYLIDESEDLCEKGKIFK